MGWEIIVAVWIASIGCAYGFGRRRLHPIEIFKNKVEILSLDRQAGLSLVTVRKDEADVCFECCYLAIVAYWAYLSFEEIGLEKLFVDEDAESIKFLFHKNYIRLIEIDKQQVKDVQKILSNFRKGGVDGIPMPNDPYTTEVLIKWYKDYEGS